MCWGTSSSTKALRDIAKCVSNVAGAVKAEGDAALAALAVKSEDAYEYE